VGVTVTRKINANLDKALKELDKLTGKVGWFKSSIYRNGEAVAYIATIQEYGVPEKGIPARPFMRPTIAANQEVWKKILLMKSAEILEGTRTAKEAMESVLIRAKADIQKTISELQDPPLAASTIAARLRKKTDQKTLGLLSKPLVDTGHMRDTVSYEIEKL